jgi:hypothetical protein
MVWQISEPAFSSTVFKRSPGTFCSWRGIENIMSNGLSENSDTPKLTCQWSIPHDIAMTWGLSSPFSAAPSDGIYGF